ncbi:MAG: aminoglycoside adenylyltransferase domain-containing protein [Candidatus Thorarchaeota archaeon]
MSSNLCGYNTCPQKITEILDRIVNFFSTILEDNLIGIYLHGSLAMDCFNPVKSDIDLIIIVNNELNLQVKKQLIKESVDISDLEFFPQKGLEYSIILQKYLQPFIHPTPFELHFSGCWKEKFREGYIEGIQPPTDRDLAAHLMVTYQRGICLFGESIKKVIPKINHEEYIDALFYDFDDYQETIITDSVYSILNSCRILYYFREKAIASKLEGGLWAKEELEPQYIPLISEAINVYSNKTPKFNISDVLLRDFYNYISKLILSEKEKAF